MKKHQINSRRTIEPLFDPESKQYGFWNFAIRNELPIYPFCVEEISRKGNFWFAETACRFMIVLFVTAGDIRYRFGTREEYLCPGRVLIIPPGQSYFFQTGPAGFYNKIVLEVMGSALTQFSEKLGFHHVRVMEMANQSVLTDQVQLVGSLLREREEEQLPELLGKTYSILSALSMNSAQARHTTSDLLQRARARLESDFNNPLRLADLARELGASEATINRAFRDALGVTPMRYRLEYKLERARYLLLHTELSVKEVAYATGYCNAFYFSREFHRLYGESPRKLRTGKSF